MNLFKTYTYTWKQIGVFKVALLAIGILIGSYAHEFFGSNVIPLALIAVVATSYIVYVSFRQ
jgi:hypothetical protein